MIEIKNGVIHIKTKNNSYVSQVNKYLDIESLHYGTRIGDDDISILQQKRTFIVNTLYEENDSSYCLDGIGFEYSYPYRGDSRSSALIMGDCNGSMTNFLVESIDNDKVPPFSDMPIPKGYDNTLCITLVDKIRPALKLELWYLVYEDTDVIARFSYITNNCDNDIEIYKIMSAQYDISQGSRELIIFDGAWGRERQMKKIPLASGKLSAGSYSGMSSAECSPFFMVKDFTADERKGDAFAFNLIYSASHEIGAQVDPYGKLRITHGIQSEGFAYKLHKKESFVTPIAISTFSNEGIGKVSQNMQRFVSQNIAPKKSIPIMLNSWESVYFDINENKLKQLADKAKELGFDGIVIDDGWFVGRNDDTAALGDWREDKSKFPKGINEFSNYLRARGMSLGIWIEPEMISENSQLYKSHPNWALKINNARNIVGRNQRILDITLKEVSAYIFESLEKLVSEYGASYIKWDFNRRFADIAGNEGSAYFYRYIRSLYKILNQFTQKYPDIIIENCASGGGRFDLGMLSYCPIGWVSDNTDPLSRAEIQEGTSYGFPIRTMLNHISESPSHQTKRISNMSTRKHTAFIGAFGAQYDVTKLNQEEYDEIKTAIKEYKNLQNVIYDGILYRISPNNNMHIWQILSEDSRGIIYLMNKRFYTVSALPRIKLLGLDSQSLYVIRGDNFEIKANGKSLMEVGFELPMNNQGIGESYLNLYDISTMILYIEKAGK